MKRFIYFVLDDVLTIDVLLHTILVAAITMILLHLGAPTLAALTSSWLVIWHYEIGQVMVGRDLPYHKALLLDREPHKISEAVTPWLVVAIAIWSTS